MPRSELEKEVSGRIIKMVLEVGKEEEVKSMLFTIENAVRRLKELHEKIYESCRKIFEVEQEKEGYSDKILVEKTVDTASEIMKFSLELIEAEQEVDVDQVIKRWQEKYGIQPGS